MERQAGRQVFTAKTGLYEKPDSYASSLVFPRPRLVSRLIKHSRLECERRRKEEEMGAPVLGKVLITSPFHHPGYKKEEEDRVVRIRMATAAL